jgi:hypothetical protein
MQNKYIIVLIILFFININSFSNPIWGSTGHRTLTKVAEKHLKKSVKRKINKILNGQSLAYISTYADEIKSDKRYRKFSAWHYVNFPFGSTYQKSEKSSYGDLVVGINTCIEKLKDENASNDDKTFYLKMLVHLVGDLHQPLHVGRKEDKGGNMIQVQWHGKGTNLHHVWDEDMINKWDMSYRELADNVKPLSKVQIKNIQSGTVVDWVNEMQKLAIMVYKSAKNGDKLSWKYSYDHFGLVHSQLQKGGLRLAKILNKIFE